MGDPVVGAAAQTIFQRFFSAAEKHLCYIWKYKKNMADLQTQVEKLDEVSTDNQHAVTVAERNAHKIKDRVKGWQNGASKIKEGAMQITNDDKENGKKRCLMGLCPNLVLRYQFSKRASKKEIEIVNAIREAEGFGEVADRAIGLGKVSALSTEGCFTFDSRKEISELILKTLQDETMSCVGVYGLGGMGKTTLAKQVASQVTKEKMFEEVVMASVTQKVDMKEIQGQIASMLDLKLEESSVAERASRIHERLKGKKVLVVLDDLWAMLDLKEVGIPSGAEHMGCKVLLTSRFLPVLSSMGICKEYFLRALEEDEAWRLFEKKVIHIVGKPTFLTIGKKVAKKCAGLPILIVTTAASLAKRPDLDAWNDALAQLEKMNNKSMHDIVNSAIESISYKCLNETHKRLFLLCGLMQGDVEFEDILKYSLGRDLFSEEEIATVEGARSRLCTLITDLREYCLLLDGYPSHQIRMHDVVRDVALSIARKDRNAFSVGNNDTNLSRWPNNDVLKKCTAMVFNHCPKLPCFPERLECPSLELFVLDGFDVDSKPTIPETFFERTCKLKVLDMSGLYFQTLPSSLTFLKDLQSLHLDHCKGLQDISIVGGLKKLQVLSLMCSDIQELPRSLSQLSELKLLDLHGCSKLEVIPAGLIDSLSQLEELDMSGCPYSFAELKCLRNLSSMKVRFPDANLLTEYLSFENLKRYEIIVGNIQEMMRGVLFDIKQDMWVFKTSISLQLGTDSINHLQHVVDTLFKRTECLSLGDMKGINNVIPRLNEDGFPELKYLCIVEDYDIQYIANVEDKQHKYAFFPALESLYLSGLFVLEKICNAVLMEGSFYKLTTLKVHGCDKMESLFSFSAIIALPCLQEIEVSRCELLKQVVAREEGETKTEAVIFPQLSLIWLEYLPNLTTFCSGLVEEMTTRETVETVTQPLFDEKVQFPNLKALLIENLDSITTIWPNTAGISQNLKKDSFCKLEFLTVTSCASLLKTFSSTMSTTTQIHLKDKPQDIPIFQSLSEVTVYNCKRLKFVFPAFVARSMNQLMKISVEDCGVETIIGGDEDAELERLEAETTTFTFPKLVRIRLERLRKMECFCPREHTIEWPALKVLDVVNCDKLRVLDLLRRSGKQGDDQIAKVISNLKRLSIRSEELSSLLGLCGHFPPRLSLEVLTISEFHGELSTLPSEFLSLIHHQLQTFQVHNCSFREIFSHERDVTDHVDDDFLFPKLRVLTLEKLQELEYIPNILEGLEVLSVMECPRLTNLVLPSSSFRLLMELEISNCGGLINLFRPSTATSLEQLRKLSISECEMIEGIIGGEVRDDDEESSFSCGEDGITLNRLWKLTLEKLPRLTNFCSSRNYTFNFPELYIVYVKQCPNLKTFCGGITTTPKLNDVSAECWSEKRWEGDLNTTIEKIYEEREAERLATTLPSILPTKHSEAQAQEESVDGTYTCEKSKGKGVEVSKQGVEHFEKSETPRYSDPSCSNYTASSSQEAQGLTTSLRGQLEQETESREKSTKECRISKHGIHDLGTGTSLAASSSQQKHLKGSRVAKDSISLGEFVHILQTQPVNNVSAEQVEFVEDAVGLFCTYVDKAKECLERKKAISELKLQIEALEDENDVVASAAPSFG